MLVNVKFDNEKVEALVKEAHEHASALLRISQKLLAFPFAEEKTEDSSEDEPSKEG